MILATAMGLKKSPHIVWVGPPDRMFFRSQGEVKCRPGSVIPKLIEQGFKLDVLLTYDAALLPKTRLSASRVTRHTLTLDKEYSVQITKLSRGNIFPGIYMMELLNQNAALTGALLAKAALSLVKHLKRAVDVFHGFDADAGFLPLYLKEERSKSRLLRESRTFLTVNSLRDFGAFSPTALQSLDISSRYFTPDGIEFYGKASSLKAALQFCDRVAVVEGNVSQRKSLRRNGATMDGVVAANSYKIIQWLSERSVRAHIDAYSTIAQVEPELGFKTIDTKQSTPLEDPLQQAIQMWGPFPPERYGVRTLSLLVQSPKKAYAFWEWNDTQQRNLGLLIENESLQQSTVLADSVSTVGEFWFDVSPAQTYFAVLAERQADGSWRPLLRSARIRVPRRSPSENRNVVFVDVRTKARTLSLGSGVAVPFAQTLTTGDGSSAWEWTTGILSEKSSFTPGGPTSPGL
jgi:hypothetical protein